MNHHDEDDAGTGKQIKGRIKEAAGVLTDDKHLEAEGKLEKTEGEAQEKVSRLKSDVREEERKSEWKSEPSHGHRHHHYHDEDEDF